MERWWGWVLGSPCRSTSFRGGADEITVSARETRRGSRQCCLCGRDALLQPPGTAALLFASWPQSRYFHSLRPDTSFRGGQFFRGTIIGAPMALAPGTRLSQYEILSPLGAGSMGEVYRARDTRLEREVAIKVLPELMSADPYRLHRFEVEAKAAAGLNHPNILAGYQMGTYAGVPYLVSEMLECITLS